MAIVTIHEAKTTLSELIRRVEAGEEIVIARGDDPVALLKAYDKEDIARRRAAGMGCLAGKFPSPSDASLFEPMTEEEVGFWTYENDPALERPARQTKPSPRRSKSK